MPMKRDPFKVSLDEKLKLLFEINETAAKAGANFCHSYMTFVDEKKWFASSFGSVISQRRIRSFPRFTVTLIDKLSGRFESRTSFAPPRGIKTSR